MKRWRDMKRPYDVWWLWVNPDHIKPGQLGFAENVFLALL